MRFSYASLLAVLVATPAFSAADPEPKAVQGNRYSVGFGAGPQSGNGLHIGVIRGPHALDAGLGLLYDSEVAEWGYSTGLRYLYTLYTGRVNDTYAWGGGALTGNYRDQVASHVTSVGAGLGVSFHFGLPIHFYFDSGLAGYFSEGLSKHEYFPAFNGGIAYKW